MSRIGNKPITLPAKVDVTIDGQEVKVKGAKGELSMTIHPEMSVARHEDGTILVKRPTDERRHRALHGLTRALIANMVKGVSEGFQITLIVEGVGYTGEVRSDKNLVMRLGFSHEVVIVPPPNVSFEVEGKNPTLIRVKGIDKQVVGQVAANIREWRPPEPYLGKGIRYSDEIIRRKEGKAGKGK
jgi:large subunit ribosomal protein L6